MNTKLLDNLPTSKHSSIVTKCRKSGCLLKVDVDKSKVLIVDCDKFFPATFKGKKPDFILLGSNPALSLGIIELKGEKITDDHFIQQLQAGADTASDSFPEFKPKAFFAIIVHQGMATFVTKRLNSKKDQRIRFRGKDYPINTARCGVGILSKLLC